MRLSDLTKWHHHSAALFYERIGKSAQAFSNYVRGKKGRSKFVQDIADELDLLIEHHVLFEDAFQEIDGIGSSEDANPAYWLSLALDSLERARDRGADEKAIDKIAEQIKILGREILSDDFED